jgi:hypothetical protein
MASTVICPDTGKSIKNSELITLLHYKIRWMRSTANEIGSLAQGLKHGIKKEAAPLDSSEEKTCQHDAKQLMAHLS